MLTGLLKVHTLAWLATTALENPASSSNKTEALWNKRPPTHLTVYMFWCRLEFKRDSDFDSDEKLKRCAVPNRQPTELKTRHGFKNTKTKSLN